jgi:hypothetical protein
VVEGAFHDERNRKRDLGGENVLIATEFFYFGEAAIELDERFSDLVATSRGHKNSYDEDLIDEFWNWLDRKAGKNRRIGDPLDFDGSRCPADLEETEDDDVIECGERKC